MSGQGNRPGWRRRSITTHLRYEDGNESPHLLGPNHSLSGEMRGSNPDDGPIVVVPEPPPLDQVEGGAGYLRANRRQQNASESQVAPGGACNGEHKYGNERASRELSPDMNAAQTVRDYGEAPPMKTGREQQHPRTAKDATQDYTEMREQDDAAEKFEEPQDIQEPEARSADAEPVVEEAEDTNLEIEDVDEPQQEEMAKMMGFSSFGSSSVRGECGRRANWQGRHVDNNADGYAEVRKERSWRQYMNRCVACVL